MDSQFFLFVLLAGIAYCFFLTQIASHLHDEDNHSKRIGYKVIGGIIILFGISALSIAYKVYPPSIDSANYYIREFIKAQSLECLRYTYMGLFLLGAGLFCVLYKGSSAPAWKKIACVIIEFIAFLMGYIGINEGFPYAIFLAFASAGFIEERVRPKNLISESGKLFPFFSSKSKKSASDRKKDWRK